MGAITSFLAITPFLAITSFLAFLAITSFFTHYFWLPSWPDGSCSYSKDPVTLLVPFLGVLAPCTPAAPGSMHAGWPPV